MAALADDDQVGIIAFSGKAGIVLPVQRKPDAAVVTASLRKISPAGGTDILAGLTAAAAALEASKTQLHHIILFTDGFTDPATLAKTATFAGELYARGITVSVLATGETGAGDALKAVADAGHGRFYPGKDLRAIPQILAEEALLASRTLIVEGEALPRITGPAAAVRTLRAAPTLDGYVATTPKPAATTAMRIGAEDDPLLATWTIGLGRATSWTSDAGARWATRWTTWDGFVTFWTATVKETFSSADPIDVRTAFDGDRLRVTAETNGAAADGAVAVARIVAPDGTQAEVALERTGPSSFTADVRATATGTYATGVEVRTDGATDGAAAGVGRALVERASSPEYRPGAANRVALARASIETGGVEEVAPTAAFRSAGLHAGRDRVDLRPWLLALAALVWPVDVALRRLRIRLARPASAASERTPSPRSRTARRDETARPKRTDTPEQIEEIAEVEQVDDSTLGALLRRTRDQRGR